MKKNVYRMLVFAVVTCLLFTASAEASAVVPGSPADPLVSQSFVEDRLNRLYDDLSDRIGAGGGGTTPVNLTDWQFDMLVEDVVRYLTGGGTGQTGHSTIFTAVHLLPGQRLMGGHGTEVVLRSGIAQAIVPGANGISDLTAGTDIMANMQIQHNHHLVIPRADGRGIRAHTEIWVLVKGPYTIAN